MHRYHRHRSFDLNPISKLINGLQNQSAKNDRASRYTESVSTFLLFPLRKLFSQLLSVRFCIHYLFFST
jgi:hypothetical protein